jgi:CO/xanthine dehydrogenase FAD-binding subunit
MSLWERYYQPSTVSEALERLASGEEPALVIAGGTDLLLDMRQGRHPPARTLVDVTGIEEMSVIEEIDDALCIGAAVTHSRIISHPAPARHAACLAEACALIGGPQVRNLATIGGNVAHALPAADGTIALLALGAEAEIAAPEGRRWESLEDLFEGPGRPAFDRERELIVRFRFPCRRPGQASAFRRVMRPQGVAIAVLNMAIWLHVTGGIIEAARLSAGPGGPKPFRAHSTEDFLAGKPAGRDALDPAAEILLGEIQLRTSAHRASKTYREHLVRVLLNETFRTVLARLEEGE